MHTAYVHKFYTHTRTRTRAFASEPLSTRAAAEILKDILLRCCLRLSQGFGGHGGHFCE